MTPTMPRISTLLWAGEDWPAAADIWRRAEELGFDTAWVSDHVAWRGNTPWHDGFALLAAAAATTSRIRLGTLVTSPNFRHPVPVATAAKTIDAISGGRLTLGVGSGGTQRSSDAGILGDDLGPRRRADRFAEWLDLLDRLLRGPETTFTGDYYSARDVITAPGCVQQPRVPFAVAGTGRRAIGNAARYATTWITTGSDAQRSDSPRDNPEQAVREQIARLEEACAKEERDPASVRRLLLTGFTGERWRESLESFRDHAGRYAQVGITDVAIHWPRPGTEWDTDPVVFEAIAAEAVRSGQPRS